MTVRPLLLLLGFCCAAQALFLALVPLQGVAHLNDEVAYTVQARLAAAGMRLGPGLEGPEVLDYPFVVVHPQVYGIFPPGWPVLLALGEALGLGVLVNPLLALALPALAWLVAREWLDEAGARLAAGVMAFSPGVLLLAASRMPHTSALAALLLTLAVLLRGRDRPWAWWAAGAALGYITAARPFDGVVIGGPLALWGLTRAPAAGRSAARLGLLLPHALGAAWVLWDNQLVTGDWRTFPASAWFDAQAAALGAPPGCNSLGFGPERGCVETQGSLGHTPLKALHNAASAAVLVDRLLLGVPGGGLVALVGLWAAGRRGLWLGLLALTVGGYALYWSPGIAYGARFWHPLYAVLPIGVAWALTRLPGRWAGWVPVLLGPVGVSFVARDLASGYWCVDGTLTRELQAQGIEEGVLLVRGAGQCVRSWPALGVEAFGCDATLAQGELLQRWDPTDPTRGLQPRRAPRDAAVAQAWVQEHHPGAAVWLLRYNLCDGQRDLSPLNPSNPPAEAP